MREIEQLKEEILRDYPRLNEDSEFSFRCHPGVSCFNACCGDVNIFLTPYDIIRLKRRLGLTSAEVLSRHTISPFDKELKYPVVLLQMQEDEKKSCPFVGPEGCGVYTDRPWSCRMYPLGMASPSESEEAQGTDFYFLMKESICQGHSEPRTQTVGQWLTDQEIRSYHEVGEHFKDLTLHRFFQKGGNLSPEKIEMFFMVCYNLDTFRDFLFKSTFFEKFDVDAETRARIESDDVELFKFGCRWLRFSLFGEQTMTVKADVLQAKEQQLAERKVKR